MLTTAGVPVDSTFSAVGEVDDFGESRPVIRRRSFFFCAKNFFFRNRTWNLPALRSLEHVVVRRPSVSPRSQFVSSLSRLLPSPPFASRNGDGVRRGG
jgi:hypothetical protein